MMIAYHISVLLLTLYMAVRWSSNGALNTLVKMAYTGVALWSLVLLLK